MQLKSIIAKVTAAALAAAFAIALTSFSALAASEFEGTWKVKDSSGEPFEITLSADGSAKASRFDLTGTWQAEQNAAVIKWNSGWTNKITKEGNTFKNTVWAKGKSLDGPPTGSSDAEKTS